MGVKTTNYGNKTIYVRDWAAWERASQEADKLGMSMSDYIALALERMTTPPSVIEDKLNRIAAILAEKPSDLVAKDREWKPTTFEDFHGYQKRQLTETE